MAYTQYDNESINTQYYNQTNGDFTTNTDPITD